MTEVEELNAAADRIEQASEQATEGPWWFDESDNCWRLHGVMGRIPPQMDGLIPEQILNKQILKAAKRNTPYAEYWPEPADAAWIILANPVIGKPMAQALRQHADDHSTYACEWAECGALALARSVNARTGGTP